MNDDYLWDGSGEPDPEVARLERLLRPLRQAGPVPELPALEPRARRRGGAPAWTWAAAAAVLVALGSERIAGPGAGWEVARLEGAPRVGEVPMADRARLAVGEWLETNDTSRARIAVGSIGEVDVEPRSRIRLVDVGTASHRLSLSRGVLHARIWAQPARFLVDTPSATAVDLGCAYTLEVDEDGAGRVTVASGWVGFKFEGRESFVPRGARCGTRPQRGPGTPYFLDASEELRTALARLDFGPEGEGREDLAVVLREARQRDALSLWHLLTRVGPEDGGRVYARLAELVSPPSGVTREGVLQGDQRMLDRWWNALGLDDVSWWRLWERPWNPPAR